MLIFADFVLNYADFADFVRQWQTTVAETRNSKRFSADEQVYIRPASKQRRGGRLTQDELFDLIWYIEWQVGFEIPNEASYFALSCKHLN